MVTRLQLIASPTMGSSLRKGSEGEDPFTIDPPPLLHREHSSRLGEDRLS